ncbi:MAG TPA: aldehyde dehydrogenase family protein [Solirubrobacteraceae bacterium]|nr:aldehyde dehydrogenase family protein [Solirubrobacteraceae bacterium]
MSTTAAMEVHSPFTGELVGEAPVSGPSEVRDALDAAAAYQNALSRHERSELLFAVAGRLGELAPELATLISRESGLCLKDTRHEVRRAVDVFRFAAIEALHDDGEAFPGDVSANGSGRRAHTMRVPVRLVAAITPFNHPLNQVAHKLAPAIAAGAPIVLKPSERTPLTALRLAGVLGDCGLPGAAAEVVCGSPSEIVDEFLTHEGVEVISFTGGVAVGKSIAARLGYRRAVLELGGNDPLLVLADADLEEAAALAVRGAFQNSGQRCTAVKRIIAVAPVADELADRIVALTRALSCGDPLEEATDVGTVIDSRAAEAIEARIAAAVDAGATLLCGGERDGALLAPAVLDHVPVTAELVERETFGPVAPIIRVRDLDEAIAVANATPYALSSAVCTFDWRAIARCVRELRAGTVNIREVPGWRTELTPFGGIGDSGLGVKEGVREAIRAMSFTKLYTLPWG